MNELTALKLEYYNLHNDLVKEHNTPDRLWSLIDFSEDDNGMGESVTEICGLDSRTGRPILFEVPTQLLAYDELGAGIKQQELEIRASLEAEIKKQSFFVMTDDYNKVLDVEEIVKLQFFQEDDLVEAFIEENAGDNYCLESLRELQHEAIANLEDIAKENQNARDSV